MTTKFGLGETYYAPISSKRKHMMPKSKMKTCNKHAEGYAATTQLKRSGENRQLTYLQG